MAFEAAAGIVIVIAVLFMVAMVAVGIAVLVLIYMAANRIPPHHRKMDPGLVFLLLIPLFGMVWYFFVVLRISEGFRSYFNEQGRTNVGDCGKGVGIGSGICSAVSIISLIPAPVTAMLGSMAGLASLVLVIIYLVTISGLKKQIPQMGYGPPMR